MTPSKQIVINNRVIGTAEPAYIIAEMSANHGQNYERAVSILRAAREAGADAIKLQTYTPDTMTLDCRNEWFRISRDTIWGGRTLYDLYHEACIPWEWQPKLKALAHELGMDFFSTAYDERSVDFLEDMDVPVHKIASFELVDLPLIKRIAATGKPLILSTGMATLAEIDEALTAARESGAREIALLKCTSAYPARPEEMNLRTIPHMAEAFGVPVGLSDHTEGIAVPVSAVSLGACIVEKHLTLSRSDGGPDSLFSLEPPEFKAMVDAVRRAEQSLGSVKYGLSGQDSASRLFRRSLFVVADMKQGDQFTSDTIRSIRPGHGLHTRYMGVILGRRATRDIEAGSPLTWPMVL